MRLEEGGTEIATADKVLFEICYQLRRRRIKKEKENKTCVCELEEGGIE